METYKVKDLKIVRPLKLIRTHSYIKFQIPKYNLFYKLGLLPARNKFSAMAIKYGEAKSLKDRLSKIILSEAPDYLYESSLICEESIYSFSASDTAIAIFDVMTDQYVNVLTGEHYDIYGVTHQLCRDKHSDLIVYHKVFPTNNLTGFLTHRELDKLGDEACGDWSNLWEKFYKEEITLDELSAIIDEIIFKEEDKKFMVTSEKTPMENSYVTTPFYDIVYTYDINGNKVTPINRVSVKEKVLKK